MAGLPAKKLDEEIRSSIRNRCMLGKLLGRRHQDRQFHQLLEPVQIAEMFLRG